LTRYFFGGFLTIVIAINVAIILTARFTAISSIVSHLATRRNALLRYTLCMAVVFAQLLSVAHIHAADTEQGVQVHDCVVCLSAAQLDSAAIETTHSHDYFFQQYSVIVEPHQTAIESVFLSYLSRAPPAFSVI
jgi:hypothetical protein